MNWIRSRNVGILVALVMTLICLGVLFACNRNTVTLVTPFDSPVSMLATPYSTIDYSAKYYTTTMELPDGQILPKYCYYTGMESQCKAAFPNGEMMPANYTPSWSPDGKFALVCGGYTSHDTSCSLYGVCDLIEGKCGNYDITGFHQWVPDVPHTVVYFYRSSSLGQPDYVAAFNPETGNKEVWFEECPDWFPQEYAEVCSELPTIIVGGQLENLPDDVDALITIHNLDGDNHFGPLVWLLNEKWYYKLGNSSGKLYSVTIEADGYVSVPFSYTIQVSGDKTYILSGGEITTNEATHLDFHFQKSD